MEQKKKILIVEDEAINAISLRISLKRLGYDFCELVSTGEQAIRLVDREGPALVIMDINLAGQIDGLKAAEIIRSQHDIPIIFLTGYADADILNKADALERTICIIKPTNPDEISRAVKEFLAE